MKLPSIHPSSLIEISSRCVIPESTHIEAGTIIQIGERARLLLGEKVTIYPGVIIRASRGTITIGDDVSLGPGVKIYEPRGGLTIGNSCLIAAGVAMCGVNHGYSRQDIPMREQETVNKTISIGDDVWIGMNTVINPGVTIGSHAIIGSGSVVTKRVGEYSIAYGNPCREYSDRRQKVGQ